MAVYSYEDLLADLPNLRGMGAHTGVIGKTALGLDIPYAHVGAKDGRQVLIQGAIHAREHITAQLVVELAYYALETTDGGAALNGGIYFIPMVNIDGVRLCQQGLSVVPDLDMRQFLLGANGDNGANFDYWKANIEAVDLNVNFPARWGTGAQNVTTPNFENYIGPAPASEPETRALMDFSMRVLPALTISYHCVGREIYWEFYQAEEARARDKAIAERFAAETGYATVDGSRGSAGGYKDWCVQDLKIPAYTFEILPEGTAYPVDYAALIAEFPLNKDIPLTALEIANNL